MFGTEWRRGTSRLLKRRYQFYSLVSSVANHKILASNYIFSKLNSCDKFFALKNRTVKVFIKLYR
jgi:hypothetical protein